MIRRAACLAALVAAPAFAEEVVPKLGPNAVAITQDTEYLRANPAPDYWAFTPFVKPQFTNSACSVASVTSALNGLAGLPQLADETVMTQPGLLELTADPAWSKLSAEGGDGVTFAQLGQFASEALKAREMNYSVQSFHPVEAKSRADAEAEMRRLLEANEASADDALLVYFNQGVVTGDWDGPHVSVVGAYDKARDRVLVLEVDQEWLIPYWTPASVLMDAMLKPTSAEHGPLEGETGGLVHIKPAS